MRCTIDARERSILIQAIRSVRDKEPARTGVHLSTIVNDMIRSQETKTRPEMDEATMLTFQEVGNVVEDIIAAGLAARYPGWTKPRPKTYRGIICSPDGWSPRAFCIDECKAVWKSECSKSEGPFVTLDTMDLRATRLEEGSGTIVAESAKFTGYKIQTLGYMKAWGATRARLTVLFMNGNYNPPFPDPVTFLLRPSQQELDDNWNLIEQHGRDMGLLK